MVMVTVVGQACGGSGGGVGGGDELPFRVIWSLWCPHTHLTYCERRERLAFYPSHAACPSSCLTFQPHLSGGGGG